LTDTLWLVIGAALNTFLALGAWAKKSLTTSGALSAVVIGFGIFFAGRFYFWSLLMAFFLTSTLLSHFRSEKKQKMEELTGRGTRRDAVQAFANGGVALILALTYRFTGRMEYLAGFGAALAAANADTWASELGILSRRKPVSVLNLKPVPRGTSGGVSGFGFLASFLGAALIAGVFLAGQLTLGAGIYRAVISSLLVAIAGFLGSLFDSVLGASVQAQYYDRLTGAHTEKRISGRKKNELVRGFPIIGNDTVNFLSIAGAAACAVLLCPLVC
jgi:uncharacterized protein (TIGR00297 family)